MSPLEIACGYVFGHTAGRPRASCRAATARDALEQAVTVALRRPPCGVAFSGGRDSSLILAVATHVARRDGFPDPVPITKVFPHAPATDETEWQELVVRHLRLNDWQRVVLDDELDLVGPLAATHLLRHGVLWPPTIHADVPIIERVTGGSLLDGEGGDEVLGVAQHRIAPMTNLLRNPRHLRRSSVRAAVAALAPANTRAARLEQQVTTASMPWIRPPLLSELSRRFHEGARTEPLSFASSVRMVPRRRSFALLAHNQRLLAEDADVVFVSPLLDQDVVEMLAREGGWLGRGDRTAALRALASDLLPDAVLSRTTKAEFGGAFWAGHARGFAERWTGDGVDGSLVDPDALKRLWCSDDHHALTSALLQQAWLADVGDSHERSVP
jgi:asparagine synthase (glutamine-hydrolysing)